MQFFKLLILIVLFNVAFSDFCDRNCEICETEVVCIKCEEGLFRELKEGKCVCQEGYIQNERRLCESESQLANNTLIVLSILFLIGFSHYIFSARKSNPILNGKIFRLKHRPIPLDKQQQQKIKKIAPDQIDNTFSEPSAIVNTQGPMHTTFQTINQTALRQDISIENKPSRDLLKSSQSNINLMAQQSSSNLNDNLDYQQPTMQDRQSQIIKEQQQAITSKNEEENDSQDDKDFWEHISEKSDDDKYDEVSISSPKKQKKNSQIIQQSQYYIDKEQQPQAQQLTLEELDKQQQEYDQQQQQEQEKANSVQREQLQFHQSLEDLEQSIELPQQQNNINPIANLQHQQTINVPILVDDHQESDNSNKHSNTNKNINLMDQNGQPIIKKTVTQYFNVPDTTPKKTPASTNQKKDGMTMSVSTRPRKNKRKNNFVSQQTQQQPQNTLAQSASNMLK